MSGRLRGWKRGAAFAAIVSLFFHAALLLAHTPLQAAANDAGDAPHDIVLCTSLGLQTLAAAELDADASTTVPEETPERTPEKNSAPIGATHCPVCLAAQLSGFAVLAGDIFVPRHDVATSVVQSVHYETHLAAILIADSAPRAPPSIV